MTEMPAAAAPRPTAIRWRICALLTAAGFIAYLLRTNMSVAGEPMAADLGLSRVQLGLVLGAFAWGYALFQFPGGVFGDVMGARRALTLMALAWGGLNLLVGLLPARGAGAATLLLLALLALRFLMGVVQAPLFPVTGGGTICNWFPSGGWALPNAVQNAGITVGAAVTGPVIAWLSVQYGWRASFAITAPIAFLLAAVWWWYGRDHPGHHRSVNGAERALIDAGRAPPAAAEPGLWKTLLRNRQIQLLTLGYFCSNYVFYFFFNWLIIYLVDSRGMKLLEGGSYAAAPWITGAAGAVLGGWLCDRLWRRFGPRLGCRVPGAAGMLLCGGFLVAASLATTPVIAVVFLALCLGGQQIADGVYWAATIAVAGRRSAAACGVLNTGGNIVGGIGAVMVPVTVDSLGWPVALATTALFAFAAAALWLVTAPDRPMETRRPPPSAAAAV